VVTKEVVRAVLEQGVTRLDMNGDVPSPVDPRRLAPPPSHGGPAHDPHAVMEPPHRPVVFYDEAKQYILAKFTGSSDPQLAMRTLRAQLHSLEGNYLDTDPEVADIVRSVRERFRKDGAAKGTRVKRKKMLAKLEKDHVALMAELDALRTKLKVMRVKGRLLHAQVQQDAALDGEETQAEKEKAKLMRMENNLKVKQQQAALAIKQRKLVAAGYAPPSASSVFASPTAVTSPRDADPFGEEEDDDDDDNYSEGSQAEEAEEGDEF